MYERFTDRARRVIVLAQEEARMLQHNYIGTEHLLLGLIHEGGGVAALSLAKLGIDLKEVQTHVEEIIGQGQHIPTGHIPFTPRAKKVLELALREALQLGHNYIGTEHVLLGVIREGEGVACQVLVGRFGVELTRVRQQVIQLLTGWQSKDKAETPWLPTEAAQRVAVEVTESIRRTTETVKGISEDIGKYRWQIENLMALVTSPPFFDARVSAVETGLSEQDFAEFQKNLRYEVTDPFGVTTSYPLLWEGTKLKGVDWKNGS